MSGFEEEFKKVAYEHVRSLAAELTDDETVETTDAEPPAKRQRQDTTTSGLDFLLRSKKSAAQNADHCSEFMRYLQATETVDDCDGSALEWWRKNAVVFPRCAKLARKYLAIPASSVQSERLFSATGRLISKARSRLLPDRAECLIFLNKNLDMF